MVALDYVIVAIVAISAMIGLVRGVVREVLSLGIWILAIVLALAFSDRLAEMLASRIDAPAVRYVSAFAMIFIATLVIGGVAQWLVMQLVATTGLSGTDRLIGLMFGGLRGAVVCIVAVIAVRPFVIDEGWWQASRLVPVLSRFESDVLDALRSTSDFVNGFREQR
jgi:membrane protein required for colicin V production